MRLPGLDGSLFPKPDSVVRTVTKVAEAVSKKVGNAAFELAGDGFEAVAQASKPLFNHSSSRADGKTYVVDGQTGETRAYDPQRDGDAIVYQNGILNDEQGAHDSAMALSKKTGKPVVVTYNSSEGFVPDVTQSVLDKLDPLNLVHQNRATDSQAELMYQSASSDQPRTFVSHSQGAIITRDALVRTHARLYGEKFTETLKRTHDPVRAHLEAQRYADDKMKNVKVVTAGGAALAWPPYANVTHVTNTADLVPNAFGQSVLFDPVETARELLPAGTPLPNGDRPDVVVVNEPTDPHDGFVGHSFEGVYLDDVAKHV